MSAYHDLLELPVGTEIESRRRLVVTGGSFASSRTYVRDIENDKEFSASTLDDPGSWSFTVVKPAPKKFKVGDVIEEDDYKSSSLPVGTVAVGESGMYPVIKTQPDMWAEAGDESFASFNWRSPRTIVYLPES